VSFQLVRPGGDEVGPGAVFHIRECFRPGPALALDTRLHVEGWTTAVSPPGLDARAAAGPDDLPVRPGHRRTRYENDLTVGLAGVRWFNTAVLPGLPEERGRAWLLHNVEEVGNLEFFLPDLLAQVRGEAA